MTDACSMPQSASPPAAGVNSSGPFNESAQSGISFNTIKEGFTKATLTIVQAAGDLTFEDLAQLQEQIEGMKSIVVAQKANRLFERMLLRLEGLNDPEAPNFGREFVSAIKEVACPVVVDNLDCSAVYESYANGSALRGFLNRIVLDPRRVEDEDSFVSSTSHEFFHALQKHAAPALHLSPFNSDTLAIVHPEDWMLLETVCERDAYTKQALISSMLAKTNPSLLKQRDFDIVTPKEFNEARKAASSLADAVVSVALTSLSKPQDRDDPDGPNFINHYQPHGLKNFAAGMANRIRAKETGHVFIRLELPDVWRVGNYGVGPNSFGNNVMEPLIMKRHPYDAKTRAKLDELCTKYKIPPLEKCQSLREYNNREHTIPEATRPITARAPASMVALTI